MRKKLQHILTLFYFGIILLSTDLFVSSSHDLHGTRRMDMPDWVADKVPDTVWQGKNGVMREGVRCGTKGGPPSRHLVDGAQLRAHRTLQEPICVPVIFHIILNKNGKEGDVSNLVGNQMGVLNQGFENTTFSFCLEEIKLHRDSYLRKKCYDGIKRSPFVENPENILHVFTCDPDGGLLGAAVFPWSYLENPKYHGVMVLDESLTGGTASPYNEGDVLIHEVGHYLGLYHTFQGGCSDPGDAVEDTPAEASPNWDCPSNRDSCPLLDGADPIHNFMDYTEDLCQYEFTPLQAVRMSWAAKTYRPDLGASDGDHCCNRDCVVNGMECTQETNCCGSLSTCQDGFCAEGGGGGGGGDCIQEGQSCTTDADLPCCGSLSCMEKGNSGKYICK